MVVFIAVIGCLAYSEGFLCLEGDDIKDASLGLVGHECYINRLSNV